MCLHWIALFPGACVPLLLSLFQSVGVSPLQVMEAWLVHGWQSSVALRLLRLLSLPLKSLPGGSTYFLSHLEGCR